MTYFAGCPSRYSASLPTTRKTLSARLIKRKLAQATIVIGIAIGFGVNYRFMSNLGDYAYFLYRERFLLEKYGLGNTDQLPPASDDA